MERLSFFPTPYPDECFYSIFARYYVRSGISSPKEACTKFFGCDRSLLASTVLLPRRLERMDYWIDPECGLTSKELICRHTSYPYQSVAYTDNLYREIEKIIKEGVPETGMYPLERRMIAKSNCPGSGQYLRYCPECVRNDIRKYGETYWHRLAQLPGVQYCPEHGSRIRDSAAPIEELRVRVYPASYMLRNKDEPSEVPKLQLRDRYLRIAKDSQWLLEHGRELGGHPKVSRKYRLFLQQRGYTNFCGICDRDAVRRDFREYFGDELLRDLFYYAEDPLYWLRYLQESIGFNLKPLHHVLLMEFFAGSAEGFIRAELKPEIPYTSESGPCINKLCGQYLQDTAKRIRVRTMGDEIWAWFECPYCGFRYRRSDPSQPFEEYLRHPSITDRGFLYREKLHQYLTETQLSKRAIAQRLGVSPGAVAKYVKDHDIDMSNRYKASYYFREPGDEEEKDDYYRRRVMEELEITPVMSCKDLKERVPGAYHWLIRKDPSWIHDRLVREFDKPRWNEWGKAALVELRAAYQEIRARGDPRKRINISWLARAAGINRDDIYGRLPYLPEMQKFFDEVCEPQEAWIRRRYTEIAMEKKAAGGKEFTYDDVKRKVQIRRKSYDRNKPLIESLIEELNTSLFQNKD
ncbi:MAG: TniQ family protein [Blautia sp.]|nr:TniQ family protein [Blautia sp.]